jgi:hypothetical protein
MIYESVGQFALIDAASIAAVSGRQDRRRDIPPPGIRQVARTPRLAAVVSPVIFVRPHQRPPRNQQAPSDSPAIHIDRIVPEQTIGGKVDPEAERHE